MTKIYAKNNIFKHGLIIINNFRYVSIVSLLTFCAQILRAAYRGLTLDDDKNNKRVGFWKM